MAKAQIRIGCSGYYYSNWKGKFYPLGIKPAEWLGYYSTIFNTVELNGTFYRKPQLRTLKKYYDLSGPDFKFSVKMSKYVSHIKRLRDCRQEIADFNDLIKEGLQDKLQCMLYQMPPSFAFTPENLDAVMEAVPAGMYNVVELRNQSWWNDEAYKAFTEKGITFCNVDFPGLVTPFVATTDLFYLRLHGNPELFKSSYSLDELKKFHKQIPKQCTHKTIYFNNTYYEAGYTNAAQMMEIMKVKSASK